MKFTLIILVHLLMINASAQNQDPGRVANRIVEEGFIKINGIDQWVTIKGDSTKPIVLFLHGGPGSPLSPYADAIYGKWEKDFILVQWDQRGAGKTYGRNASPEISPAYLKSNPLTIELMSKDGTELVRYLIQRFTKAKIILFGTSWGSVLGVKMAMSNPELYYAYVGHSQVVAPSEDLIFDYRQMHRLAQTANDKETLSTLQQIGEPPYDTARNAGKLLRIIKKYQGKNATPAPPAWWNMAPAYDNQNDNQDRENGDDYSFLSYVGDKRFDVSPINTKINFLKDGLVFKIPVYIIQGEEDMQTPAAITRAYFEKISAPSKKLILVPRAEHGFNQPVVDIQYRVMKEYIQPTISR
ncbi:MAG TPA: alpha/beta hydrolase [Flavitalea sp.]|nr:alpha/beta hydrolase [Flavitalea sp.]